MAGGTELTVMIATRGRPDLLERTLQSLAACERPLAFAGTIVVENGDRLGAEHVVRQAPPALKARYLFHPDGNKSASLNAALAHVRGGLVLFLDDDVVVGPRLLMTYAAASAGTSGGQFFGGPVFADYERTPPAWLIDYLPFSARGWALDAETDTVDLPIFLGANWAAFVEDLRAAGGFDPAFGPGAKTGSVGQERLMQRRLLDAGRRGRYLRGAEVWHWVPRNRCSVRWAVHRIYRDGINRGLNENSPADTARILGYPRWAVRRALEHAGRVVISSVRPRSKAQLDALRQFLLSTGFLKGSRLAHLNRGRGLQS